VCPSELHGKAVRFYHINKGLETSIRASLEISTNMFAWEKLSSLGTLSRERMGVELENLFATAYSENQRDRTDEERYLIRKYVELSETPAICISYEKLIEEKLNHSPQEIGYIHISANDSTWLLVLSVLDFYADNLSSELSPPEIFCFDTTAIPFNDFLKRRSFSKLGYDCNKESYGFSGDGACCFRGQANKLAKTMEKNELEGIPLNFQCSSSIEYSVDFLIFTKDRPHELANLLASIYRHARGFSQVHVIYKYTFDCGRDGYNLVKQHFPHVQFWDESIVKNRGENSSMFEYYVKKILKSADASHIIPLVGETAFIRPVDLRSMARSLACFDDMSTVQLRLGTNLAIYADLFRDGKEQFSSFSDVDTRLLKFNSNMYRHLFRVEGNGEIHTNHFWVLGNMCGVLISITSFQKHLNLIGSFNHPGELELGWYKTRDLFPTHHLMPITSYIVGNDADAETRPDHLSETLAPHESTTAICLKFVKNYESAILTGLDGTKPKNIFNTFM
jgi:hypothetical protein